MLLVIGQGIELNQRAYTVVEELGGGALARVYLLELADRPGTKVVLKVAQRPLDPDVLDDKLILEGLREESKVLPILNRAEDPDWPDGFDERLRRAQETRLSRRIVALFDSGEPNPNEPYAIEEKAPPKFEHFPVASSYDEQCVFRIFADILEGIELVHNCQYSLKDFDPVTKDDRIRLQWIDADRTAFEIKIIDWNVTGGPAETPRDLLFIGGHLLHALASKTLYLGGPNRDWVPIDLNLDDPKLRLSPGARLILKRLLHREPSLRYHDVTEVKADIYWWLEILVQETQSNFVSNLNDQLTGPEAEKRIDRRLALAEMGIKLTDADTDIKNIFHQIFSQAQEDISLWDERVSPAVSDAYSYLDSGYFTKVADMLAKENRNIDPLSKTARLGRLYIRLAQDGELLKNSIPNSDRRSVLSLPTWENLKLACEYIKTAQYQNAWKVLSETGMPENGKVKELAQVFLWIIEAKKLLIDIRQLHEPLLTWDEWGNFKERQREQIRQMLEKLELALRLAPDEPDVKAELHDIRELMELQDKIHNHGQTIRDMIARAYRAYEDAKLKFPEANISEYENIDVLRNIAESYKSVKQEIEATTIILQELLQTNPTIKQLEEDWKALNILVSKTGIYAKTAEKRANILELKPRIIDAINVYIGEGDYKAATHYLDEQGDIHQDPDLARLELLLKTSPIFAKQSLSELEIGISKIKAAQYSEAQVVFENLLSWDGKPIGELPEGDKSLLRVRNENFTLPKNIREVAIEKIKIIKSILGEREKMLISIAGQDTKDFLNLLQKFKVLLIQQEINNDPYIHWFELFQEQQEKDSTADIKELIQWSRELVGAPEQISEAVSARARARWLQLVLEKSGFEKPDFWEKTILGIKDGLEHYPDLRSTNDLQLVLNWISKAQSLKDELYPLDGMYPVWFGKDNWKERIRKLNSDLDVLTQQEDIKMLWPSLVAETEKLNSSIIELQSNFEKLVRGREAQEKFNHLLEILNETGSFVSTVQEIPELRDFALEFLSEKDQSCLDEIQIAAEIESQVDTIKPIQLRKNSFDEPDLIPGPNSFLAHEFPQLLVRGYGIRLEKLQADILNGIRRLIAHLEEESQKADIDISFVSNYYWQFHRLAKNINLQEWESGNSLNIVNQAVNIVWKKLDLALYQSCCAMPYDFKMTHEKNKRVRFFLTNINTPLDNLPVDIDISKILQLPDIPNVDDYPDLVTPDDLCRQHSIFMDEVLKFINVTKNRDYMLLEQMNNLNLNRLQCHLLAGAIVAAASKTSKFSKNGQPTWYSSLIFKTGIDVWRDVEQASERAVGKAVFAQTWQYLAYLAIDQRKKIQSGWFYRLNEWFQKYFGKYISQVFSIQLPKIRLESYFLRGFILGGPLLMFVACSLFWIALRVDQNQHYFPGLRSDIYTLMPAPLAEQAVGPLSTRLSPLPTMPQADIFISASAILPTGTITSTPTSSLTAKVTSTPIPIPTSTITAPLPTFGLTPIIVLSPSVAANTPELNDCNTLDAYRYKIIEGPKLEPPEGTQNWTEKQVFAIWIVQNDGACSWDLNQIELRHSIVKATVTARRLDDSQSKLVQPHEQVELRLTLTAQDAINLGDTQGQKVIVTLKAFGEWTLFVNSHFVNPTGGGNRLKIVLKTQYFWITIK